MFVIRVCERHALLVHVFAFALCLLVFCGGTLVDKDCIHLPGLHHCHWLRA